MWFDLLFALLLVLVSAGLIGWYFYRLRTLEKQSLQDSERTLYEWLYWRRLLVSIAIGLVGFGVFATVHIKNAAALAASWSLLMLVVFWILLLALRDAQLTRKFYANLRQLNRKRLQDELQAAREKLHERSPGEEDGSHSS